LILSLFFVFGDGQQWEHTGGMFYRWILISALALSQNGQLTSAPAHPDSSVSKTDKQFVQDLRDKNIEDVLTLYSADAVFVNPDGSQVNASGLRGLYEKVTQTFDSDLHLKPINIFRHGETAVEKGTYTETLGHRDTGKIDRIQGTYVFEFKRERDGRWLYTRMNWH